MEKIELKNICIKREEKLILEGLNLQICTGEHINIIGNNGSGKTTLLRLLAGFLKHFKGNISIDETTATSDLLLKNTYYVDNKIAAKKYMTVDEDVMFWSTINNIKPNNESFYKGFNLENFRNLKIEKLSQGQKKKLSLIKLFMSNCFIWLLDEPLNGLDKESVEFLMLEINSHINCGGIIISTSHINMGKSIKNFNLMRYSKCY